VTGRYRASTELKISLITRNPDPAAPPTDWACPRYSHRWYYISERAEIRRMETSAWHQHARM